MDKLRKIAIELNDIMKSIDPFGYQDSLEVGETLIETLNKLYKQLQEKDNIKAYLQYLDESLEYLDESNLSRRIRVVIIELKNMLEV